MLSKNVLFYGKDEQLPEHIELHAGPLSMIYQGGDLRYIKLGDKEVIRRIYVAIRDRNWETILPVLSNLQMAIDERSFRITFDVENVEGEINFAWKALITGDTQGTVSFSMIGEARSTFLKNRIGFCVLYPASCAGSQCEVEHLDGTSTKAELPYYIVAKQPVPPFAEMCSLVHQVEPGRWMRTHFTGDIFEMEDQRNWTDASYKVFCTPLRIPYPAEIQKGAKITQSIVISLRQDNQETAALFTPAKKVNQDQEVNIDNGQLNAALALPPVGLGIASHGQPLTKREVARLQALHLHHLRVDLDLRQSKFTEDLLKATEQALELGVKLEVALLIQPGATDGLHRLAEFVMETRPPISTWLIYPATELFSGGSPIREVVEMARLALADKLPGVKFAAGTNTDFIFMQRSQPPYDLVDEATLAICPEVHAFDNTSLVETLEAQPQVVSSALKLAGKLPVRISPVTFKMRFNPYATGTYVPAKAPELPPTVDSRQMSLFGAGWTLGSLNALASSGASSLTFFETTGWRGIMETESGSPIPEVFQSIPGGVYPVYFVFAKLGESAGGMILPSKSSNPMVISSMLLQKGDKQRIFLANHIGKPQTVSLVCSSNSSTFFSIDETNAEKAMGNPEDFLAQSGMTIPGKYGRIKLNLLPYMIGWVDL